MIVVTIVTMVAIVGQIYNDSNYRNDSCAIIVNYRNDSNYSNGSNYRIIF